MEKRAINMEVGKTSINPMVLECNWSYPHKLITLSFLIDTKGNTHMYAPACTCMYVCKFVPLEGLEATMFK